MNIDKELRDQQAFDETPFSEEDKKLYSLLISELDKDSEIDIKPSFSAEIIRKLEAKKRKEALWEFLLFSSAIAGVIFLTIAAISFVGNETSKQLDLFQDSPVGPVIALVVLIIIFQVLDKKYLRDTRIKGRLKQS
ncbi:MAG: hypothetical protein HEP71_01155 [Roseivirga sp.]|nr:hypothetical protein [Roseivirga sp.]